MLVCMFYDLHELQSSVEIGQRLELCRGPTEMDESKNPDDSTWDIWNDCCALLSCTLVVLRRLTVRFEFSHCSKFGSHNSIYLATGSDILHLTT